MITTSTYKERIVEHTAWAVGALAIGVGVLPVLAGVAALARPKREARDPATRAFVITSVASIAVFLLYAGVKGAYISTVFGTYVVERNLIYLCPILFIATALAFHRGVGRGWAIAGAALFTLLVVAVTPLNLAQYPYYEARGLSMAAFANRELGWAEGTIEVFFIALCVVALVVVVALKLLQPSSKAFAIVTGVAAVAVVAWSMTGQVYAAEAERTFSRQFDSNLPKPYEWVEDATGGGSVVVIGQQISDPTNIWLTEFFNPSVRKMWSLDGSAREVGGPILTPDLDAVDGTLTPPPGTEYALAVNGVRLQAPIVDQRKDAVLYKIDGGPLVLQDALVGRETDGWMIGSSEDPVARASYTRYDVSRDEPGLAIVKLSRVGSCPREDLRQTATATVRIGPVGIDAENQPRIERVTEKKTFKVSHCSASGTSLYPPNVPWRMEITVSPTFVPKELDPEDSDNRRLGAQIVRADFQPLLRELGRGGDEVREARAQREACQRPRAFERLRRRQHRAGQRHRLRNEERLHHDGAEARGMEVGDHIVDAVLAWVEIEDELALRERAHVLEEPAAVPRVVDRAEDGRRRDRMRRHVVVEVAEIDIGSSAESPARRVDHLRGGVDTPVGQAASDESVPEPAVAAGEVEHDIAGHQARAERGDQLGSVLEVGRDVGVGALRPVRRLACVLPALVGHSARSRSGCLRTKRAMPRACQSVWRERKR